MTVLVTGASGFIGRHLVAELERRSIPLTVPPRRELGPDTDWADALRGVETVVHLAALAHERAKQEDLLEKVNVLGTGRLARCAAAAGVRHFIFMSTIGVHGDETFGTPFTEASELAPRSPYARSKLEAERLLTESSLPVTVIRPTLVYGPRNPGNFLRLLRWMDRGLPLPIASVRNRRSLTYVGNLVAAIVALRGKPLAGAFIVSDSQPVSTPELVRELAAGLARPARMFPFPPVALPRRLAGSLETDPSKLCRAIDWRPPFATAEALRETARWYRAAVEAAR